MGLDQVLIDISFRVPAPSGFTQISPQSELVNRAENPDRAAEPTPNTLKLHAISDMTSRDFLAADAAGEK
jgi:hypothetical protein